MAVCKMAVIKILLFLYISSYVGNSDAAFSTSFPIGGLFNNNILPNSRKIFENIVTAGGMRSVFGRVIEPAAQDSYSTAMEVCKDTGEDRGIVALVDLRPTNGICDNTCLLCNRLNISHLILGWEPTDTLPVDQYSFHYYPPPELISKAYATLINQLQWDKFTILYEDESSFVRLQEIINTWPLNKDPILFKKLEYGADNRETFKYIFKVARMTYHILDCEVNHIVKYMNEITQVENSTQYQSFILTNLDSHTINLTDVSNLMANVSTLHLTTTNDPRWSDNGIEAVKDRRVETALASDALTHLEKAIRAMQASRELKAIEEENWESQQIDYGTVPPLCTLPFKAQYEELMWQYGIDLRQALINTTAKGFTGNIQFDEEGKRTNFELYYSKLNNDDQFAYAGNWDSKTDIITEDNIITGRSMAQSSGIIKVVSRIGQPYFMPYTENGTEYYKGYAKDLVNAIFEHINKNHGKSFEPQFHKVWDNNYGSPVQGTRKWDGIIGELMDHNSDLGVCDLSITSERNSVIDFSTPFMTTGISMLFKEPEPEEPDMFSFIQPLSTDVWLYLATAYIIVSFILLICARMSQDDWVNPHPCNQNPENLENIWSFYNCTWLAMGTIMTQGCDILPRGVGSRWITGLWWFFAMIITASYTANMSTFLSNSRRSSDITNVKELSEQNKISYGAVTNASTYKFFESSNNPIYQKIWSVMSSAKPPVFTNGNEEGKNRVLKSKGKYAFFMEATAIEYFTERECQLKMVGNELDSKEYGIAMPKNFPYKSLVDNAILKLQESGKLMELKTKWWNEENNEMKCSQKKKKEKEDDSGSLQMKNTSGIFLVLGVGGVLGFLVSLVDFMLHARQIAVKEKVTFKEALLSEWNSSLNPRSLNKPAAVPRSAAGTESPSPQRERSQSRAVSVLRAASSFINFDEIY